MIAPPSRPEGNPLPSRKAKPEKGVEVSHSRSCPARDGGACRCQPSYRGHVWDNRSGKRIRSCWFPTLAQARNWRQDALVALRRGTLRAPTQVTVAEAAQEFIEGARAGSILSRKGTRYSPASVRGYERGLRLHVLPTFGKRSLSAIHRTDVQAWVDRKVGAGAAASTVKNCADPLRRIFDRAVKRELIAIDPTDNIEWPASTRGRDRIASPAEASRLLAALPDLERPLWATAIYAGLRRAELRALRWSAVDLEKNIIRVERTWDDHEGDRSGGKTEAAVRRVPLLPDLKTELVALKLATGRRDDALVFGAIASQPFDPSTTRRRALAAWKRAGLSPIGLHECRHTFASLMIAADVNIKQLSTFMGHASVAITLDRYGHLLPNAEQEAAARLQAYLERSRALG